MVRRETVNRQRRGISHVAALIVLWRGRGAIWRIAEPDSIRRESSDTPSMPDPKPAAGASVDPRAQTSLAATVRHLWPYIWPSDRADLRLRIYVALVLMVVAKLVTVAIPYSFKWATDALVGREDAAVAHLPAHPGRPAGADAGLRAAPHGDGGADPGARRALRLGRHACRAPHGQRRLRPSARTVAALPPRAQDRRPDARPGARPQRHRDDRPHDHADGRADAASSSSS